MNKQAELDALAAEIIEAGICSELADQATQLVMGDGNADADIVFIGEAPVRTKIYKVNHSSAQRGNSSTRCWRQLVCSAQTFILPTL